MASASTPAWVKVFLIVVIIAVVAVAGLHILGLAPHLHAMPPS